ncbi:MAG: bifunctional shikimate kinase/3-dehydroquinate synthase [Bowdeniella nasicola]|nr:bifunctional shikimate kinase/3-dehydroquinate synthase [Bowdeniella nasicola]
MSSVILVGMPGVGKTTVGRELATLLHLPFYDLDERFTHAHGITPADYLRRYGEPEFRKKESALITEVVTLGTAVIATGGGAIVDPLSRWQLWHAGTVVWLDAPDHVLRNRFQRDPDARPLTQDAEQIAARRAERLPFYRAADIHVDATDQAEHLARTIADRLAAIVKRDAHELSQRGRLLLKTTTTRNHPMGPSLATICFASRFPHRIIHTLLSDLSTGVPVVVADERAAAAQPALLDSLPPARQLLFAAGEEHKRLATVETMLEFAASKRAERSDAWVGLGGGTAGDMVGCGAALYLRGVPFIQMPTTWLAMCDAAIGGKVGVDLSAAKNAAGAFWPPVAVLGDVTALNTLPGDLLLDGMGETLKSAIIGDPWLWDLIVHRGTKALIAGPSGDEAARYAMVERAALVKLGVVDRDPFEAGERRNLNLGHTIAHALEVESGYRLPHGRAVILGLRAVAHMARNRGARADFAAEIDQLCAQLGYDLTRSFDANVVKDALAGDKKSLRGKIRWILPFDVGHVEQADDITEAEIDAALTHISADHT